LGVRRKAMEIENRESQVGWEETVSWEDVAGVLGVAVFIFSMLWVGYLLGF
jgi:hypothetical protein